MAVSNPDVTLEQRSGVLIVSARGVLQIDWFIAFIGDIAVKIEMLGAAGVLMDMRGMTGTMTFVDRYRAGYKAANSFLTVPIALVGNEPLVDPSRLGEMVAHNRGVNIKVFTDIAEAEQWITLNAAKRS